MNSHLTREFRRAFEQLPQNVQQRARETFRRWMEDPFQRNLQFKRVHAACSVYSVRIGPHYRAVGVWRDDRVIWFWIGSHAEYDRLVSTL